jgi:cell shape-determining protein MreC
LAQRLEEAVRRRASISVPRSESDRSATENLRLRRRLQQLEQQVASLRAAAAPNAGRETIPLFDSRLVSARVLGQQARQFLASRALLSRGSNAGLSAGGLVLEPDNDQAAAPLLDVGGETGVAAGRMVLESRAVVGRLKEVGQFTSCLERVTDASYRDRVRIVQMQDGKATPGPRGLLVGTGQPHCQVRMVDISQPIAVGDVVVADGLGGILGSPPRYGTVVRVAQSPGSGQWEIWVEPDVDVGNLDVVSVLTTDINTVRMAGVSTPHGGIQ